MLSNRICGVLFDSGICAFPRDANGCHLHDGHEEPHEFIDSFDKKTIRWQTDWECECDHCMEGLGDWCTFYWEAEAPGKEGTNLRFRAP